MLRVISVVALLTVTLAAAERNPALPFQLFPSDNWWNQDVSQAPVDPRSAQFIAFINNGGSRRLHPDFGGYAAPGSVNIYGFPYVVVGGDQPRRAVSFYYPSESDGVNHATGQSYPFYPIPDQAITEPYWIEGGPAGNQNPGGDRHMLIVDRDNRHLYELFDLRWNGLAILPGLVRYDEVFGGGEIQHAFRVTVRATNGYVWPASHRAGGNVQALPMGARLRLKASKDLSGFRPELQKIFRAMQRYGLIVADNGSDMYISGAFDPRWDNNVLNPAFRALNASDFEVIELGWRGGSGMTGCNLPTSPAPFSFSQSGPLVTLYWAPSAGASDYVIEVGSASGLSNILVTGVGGGTTLSTIAPPGLYYARMRGRSGCGLGPASNEIVVRVG
jgi:hypothetical protein